jgi:hypothetical protein
MLAPRQSFSISSLGALREVGAIRPKVSMTKAQAENVLASFVARGWLLKSKYVPFNLFFFKKRVSCIYSFTVVVATRFQRDP